MFTYRHSRYVKAALHILFFLICFPFISSGQQKDDASTRKKITVAVMNFEAREGITKGESASLSDVFTSVLISTREFVVVDRERIKAILEEQGFQESEACSKVECLVEVGKILKVEKMFVGQVGRVGSTYSINVQMVDVSTAEIQLNSTRQYEGKIDVLVAEIVPFLAAEMAEQLTGKKIEVPTIMKWGKNKKILSGGGLFTFLGVNKSAQKGMGVTARFQYGLTDKVELMASVGYVEFGVSHGMSINVREFLGGAKYHFSETAYCSGELGLYYEDQSTGGTPSYELHELYPAWGIGAGYQYRSVDFSINYFADVGEHPIVRAQFPFQWSSVQNLWLRISYEFELFF